MNECQQCGAKVDEKYKYCQQCNTIFGAANSLSEISKVLKKINWNIGLRNEFMKRKDETTWNAIRKEWKEKNKDPDLDNA